MHSSFEDHKENGVLHPLLTSPIGDSSPRLCLATGLCRYLSLPIGAASVARAAKSMQMTVCRKVASVQPIRYSRMEFLAGGAKMQKMHIISINYYFFIP